MSQIGLKIIFHYNNCDFVSKIQDTLFLANNNSLLKTNHTRKISNYNFGKMKLNNKL